MANLTLSDIETLNADIHKAVRVSRDEDYQVKVLYRRWLWEVNPAEACKRNIPPPDYSELMVIKPL